MPNVILPLSLWLLYLALTNNLQVSNLIVGALLAGFINWLLHPQLPRMNWRRLPAALWAVARYIGILFYDLILSGIQTTRILLSPKMPIHPGIIAIPSGCQSELATALSAHAMTLTPGELVVEIGEDGVMYVHCLDVSHAEAYIAEAQTMRARLLQKIFA
ncbi:MAG: Na+/H+ antiporter subunit E [Anaerolineales bacterium]